MSGLAVHELTKRYGDKTVLEKVSFTVERGEFCILLGPSGCGKSTVLRIIAGLSEPGGGSVRINGRDVMGLTPAERDVAMVFQNYALYPHMNVFENLAFPLKIKKTPKDEINARVREAAGLLGIEDLLKRKPRELSGGQQQRVAIGRAIVRKPRVFLFDEPLSNLDAKLRSEMRVELANLHRRLATTMVYVTHDQVEAMTLGSKIVVLEKGVVQQVGTPGEVYDSPANAFVAAFIGVPSINLLEGSINKQEGGFVFIADGLQLPLEKKRAWTDYIGKQVSAGIRPEFLRPGEGAFKGRLQHRERTGPEVIIYVKAGKFRLAAKAPLDYPNKIGDEVSLDVESRDILFFHEGRLIGTKT
jgi:ABC-type sugar transport system ATPase subunit